MIIMESKVIIVKRFNPEKELSKIRNSNKKKVIINICALLFIIAIGSTYALYQVRHSNRLVYTTVKDFSKDIKLAVFVNGIKQEDFPEKDDKLIYTKINCDKNEINASWDYNDWSLILESNLPNKCNVYFETRYKDNSGASYPELYQGFIPVRYDGGKIYIADLSSKWYDYDAHEWANAILIDYNNVEIRNKFYDENDNLRIGDEIQENDILQMYVWIPRYRYKLFNSVIDQTSEPQEIEIEFESNTKGRSMGSNNGDWYTHPAFLFGDTELNGIWVGKFEPSDPTDPNGREINKIAEITILPDKTSMTYKSIETVYNAERNIEKEGNIYNLLPNEIDTHPMKNMEWGAVAYLTNSIYGIYSNEGNGCVISEMNKEDCEVWINNTAQGTGPSGTYLYGGTYTGCVGNSVSAPVKWNSQDNTPAKCEENNRWNKTGVKASTTGNMYGVYDMVGGVYEYTMGVIKNETGTEPLYSGSGFTKDTMPDAKYYDLYEFSDNSLTIERGHLGDATRETIETLELSNVSWHGDYSLFIFKGQPWNLRGGSYENQQLAGIVASAFSAGQAYFRHTFRSVLTAQDGNE